MEEYFQDHIHQCPPSATRLHATTLPTPRPLTHSHPGLDLCSATVHGELCSPLLANGQQISRTWSPHEPLRGQNLAGLRDCSSSSLPPPPPPPLFLPLMETVLRLSNAQGMNWVKSAMCRGGGDKDSAEGSFLGGSRDHNPNICNLERSAC